MTSILFVACMFFGTLCLGVSDVVRKRALADGVDERHLLVGSLLVSGAALSVSLLYFGVPIIGPYFWWAVLGTIGINVVAQQLFFHAFRLNDVSLIAPLRLATTLLVVGTGFLFLGEVPSTVGVVGVMVTLVGLWFLIFPHFRPTFLLQEGIGHGLAGATLFAFSFPLDKVAVVSSSAVFSTTVILLGIALIAAAWHTLFDRTFVRILLRSVMANPRAYLALSGAYALGLLLTNQALNYSLVVYVASLKRMQALWSIILSGVFLHEPYITRRLVAVLIMLLGIALSVVYP